MPTSLSWFTSIDKDVSGNFSLTIQHYLSRSSVSDSTTYETYVPVNGGLTRKCAPLITNELIGTHQVRDASTKGHFDADQHVRIGGWNRDARIDADQHVRIGGWKRDARTTFNC